MNKSLIGIVLAVVAMGAIAGVVIMNKPETASNTNANHANNTMNDMASNKPAGVAEPSNEVTDTNSVTIIDTSNSYDYQQKKIRVKKGTTVKWTNQSNTKHDVTPDTETADFKASDLLKKGESYEVTFNTVGTFTYNCSPHPFMKGSVEVIE